MPRFRVPLRAAGLLFVLASALRAGEMRVESIASEAVDQTLRVNVLLPDGYTDDTERRWPVVYMLHGYGGDYTEWERIGIAGEARELDAIIVMPEGDRSFWVNHHGKPDARWEDWIVDELIPAIDETYRTVGRRAGRAIGGLSMGGYGAVILGLRHPDLFASVASHSGALGILAREPRGGIGRRIREIFGPEGSPERTAYDPLGALGELSPAERPHLYIGCGSDDFLLEHNRRFVRELADRDVEYEYRETPGGHEFGYWRRNVRYALERQLAALAEAREDAAEAVAHPADAVGAWRAEAERPDGTTHTSRLVVRREGDRLAARATWDDGARSVELDRVRFEDGVLVLVKDVEREGKRGRMRVEARFAEGGRLVGRWGVREEGAREDASGGAWTAERLESPGEQASGAADTEAVLGRWEATGYGPGGETLESEFTIRLEDGELAASVTRREDRVLELDRVILHRGHLELEKDLEIEGERRVVRVEADLDEPGKLEGRWSFLDAEGIELRGGEWRAERVAPPAESDAEDAPAAEAKRTEEL